MQVLIFLLETIFFFLVGAALLRGWMNTWRMRMTQQPGLFVMAITDWVVQPVRKVLPRRLAQANTDWGSVTAAVILALVYALLVHLLWGGAMLAEAGLGGVPVVLWFALKFLLRTALQGLMLLALVYAIVSWVQPASPLYGTLGRLVEPCLKPIRRWVPQIGGVDLSVLVLVVLLQVGLMLVV